MLCMSADVADDVPATGAEGVPAITVSSDSVNYRRPLPEVRDFDMRVLATRDPKTGVCVVLTPLLTEVPGPPPALADALALDAMRDSVRAHGKARQGMGVIEFVTIAQIGACAALV